MGADPKSHPYESTLLNLAGYRAGLPKLMAATNAQLLPAELARIQAAEQITPRYTNLINDANNTTSINNAALENAIFGNFGVDKARIASGIDREINPEFYSAREAGLSNLMKGYDAIGLDSDVAAERLVNAENVRSGNAGVPSNATNTVSNALSFGDEKLKRVSALDKLLNTGTTFMQGSKATFDPFGRSTSSGGGTTVNNAPAPNQFANIGAQFGQTSDSLLNNVFGTGNNALNNNANRRGTGEVVMGSLPDY